MNTCTQLLDDGSFVVYSDAMALFSDWSERKIKLIGFACCSEGDQYLATNDSVLLVRDYDLHILAYAATSHEYKKNCKLEPSKNITSIVADERSSRKTFCAWLHSIRSKIKVFNTRFSNRNFYSDEMIKLILQFVCKSDANIKLLNRLGSKQERKESRIRSLNQL